MTPPGDVRHDIDILCDLAAAMGAELGPRDPEAAWDELRELSPLHRGMSWQRLEAEGGLQWPCPDLDHPGSPFLHGWLWEDDLGGRDPAPFSVVEHEGPAEELSEQFPLRLTTGRTLDSYNTGVQSGGYDSPIRRGDGLDVSVADAAELGLVEGDRVLVSSARGSVEMRIAIDPLLPAGLTFTSFHFPDLVDVNLLTNDAWDRRSGTSEFKATAIRIDPLPAEVSGG